MSVLSFIRCLCALDGALTCAWVEDNNPLVTQEAVFLFSMKCRLVRARRKTSKTSNFYTQPPPFYIKHQSMNKSINQSTQYMTTSTESPGEPTSHRVPTIKAEQLGFRVLRELWQYDRGAEGIPGGCQRDRQELPVDVQTDRGIPLWRHRLVYQYCCKKSPWTVYRYCYTKHPE